MTSTIKKWGYKKDDARIFEVDEDNQDLPDGWYESPADIPAKAPKKKKTEEPNEGTTGDDE